MRNHGVRFVCQLFLPLLLLIITGCSTIPQHPVNVELNGEYLSTTVDSEIARYYIEDYLQGKRINSVFDKKIDQLYRKGVDQQLTREMLKQISVDYSVDFSAIFFADYLWSNEENQRLQETFRRFIVDSNDHATLSADHYSDYMVLFVPGWDYEATGYLTGSDFQVPRRLITALGIENHLVKIPSNGSVEENARYLSHEIMRRSQSSKKIIIAGASSAGPAIHLVLGSPLSLQQHRSVVAWVNAGGILQGSPLIDYMQRWPQRWLFNFITWYKDWDREKILSMSTAQSRERFTQQTLDDGLLVINYLGLSLSGQLSQHSRDKYPLIVPEGPNDGLTLLADAIVPHGVTIITSGSDHFFAEDPLFEIKTVALMKTVITYLENEVQP